MKRQKNQSVDRLLSAIAEADSKQYYDEDVDLNGLNALIEQFLNGENTERHEITAQLQKDFAAGLSITGENGIRKKLAAVDLEFFGRAYFPHYFSRPSPEFHRELDDIWSQGVLKGKIPLAPQETKTISRMTGCRCVVAAPRGHAKSTNFTFKGTMHAVLYQYKHYPIIISDSSDQAEGFLENIKVEFEENEAIREDFGDLCGRVW